MSLLSGTPIPQSVPGWYELLRGNTLVGLVYLNLFDAVDCALVGLMLLALYGALRHAERGLMLAASALGLIGIAASLSTNAALSLLALSRQFAAETTDAGRSSLAAAGQALLALGGHTGALPFGTGVYSGHLLLALSGLTISLVMMRGDIFPRACAALGLVAAGLDLSFALALAVLPPEAAETVGVATQPLAGLLLMIWHFWIGWILLRLGMGKVRAP
jgi:hypothetical protein